MGPFVREITHVGFSSTGKSVAGKLGWRIPSNKMYKKKASMKKVRGWKRVEKTCSLLPKCEMWEKKPFTGGM